MHHIEFNQNYGGVDHAIISVIFMLMLGPQKRECGPGHAIMGEGSVDSL